MRILLLQAPAALLSPRFYMSPPLGLAYIAGHLRRAGHKVEIIDLNLTGYNPHRVNLVLARAKPELVGLSAYTKTYTNALLIAAQVKAYDASIPVVFGGSHPSIMPDAVLAERTVDYVVVGEGEETLAELAVALQTGGEKARINGLVWRKDGVVVANPRRALLDPDAIGLPARDLLSLEFYADAFNVLTARGGCPYRCPFCSASHIWSGKHRPRSPQAIVDELEMLVREYSAQHVFFVDDIFTLNERWLGELLGLFADQSTGLTWGCATRVHLADEALIQRMASVGCTGIQYGIESGVQSILDSVKSIKKEDALSAVRWSVAAGIKTSCSFMVPFPEDTEETLAETTGFMRQLKDEGGELFMAYTTPYPGTLFYEEAEALGLRLLEKDWERYDAKQLVMETRHLSKERIEAIASEMAASLGITRTA